MPKTERINVRTTEKLKEKVIKIALSKGITVSELINDYIKACPEPDK